MHTYKNTFSTIFIVVKIDIYNIGMTVENVTKSLTMKNIKTS